MKASGTPHDKRRGLGSKGQMMKNDASIQRLLKDKRGNAVVNFTGKSARELFERKTTITELKK